MELTKEKLEIIATSIAELITQIHGLRTFMIDQLGADPQELHRVIEEAREAPDYRPLRDQILGKLIDA